MQNSSGNPLRTLRLVCAFASLLAASSVFAALPFPPEKEKWLKLTSGEFQIFSNAPERDTKQIAANLLRMREAVGKLTRLEVRSPLPMYVFVFRNERSFAPYRDAIFQRHNAKFTGGFLSGGSANFVVLQADAQAGVDRVIYHELTHYFLRNTQAGLPLWFDEGIAEYYSTFSARGEQVSIGRPVPEHVAWLRDGHIMPLAQLFSLHARSPEYSETLRQGVFYAESWALIHYFLVGSEQRLQQLPLFMTLLQSGNPIDEAFRTAFNASYADLESELRMYLRKPMMGYKSYSLTELQIPSVSTPQPVGRDDVLYALGNLLAHSNASTVGDAAAFLAEAVRLNPDNAPAHAALGFVHETLNDRPAATAAYERAVALGSTDPAVYIVYGTTILDRIAHNMRGPGGAAPADIARARQLFERATQLDPSSARAYAGIGATYVTSEADPTAGIAALEKSLSLGPSQDDVVFNLIQLYALAGRRADAQRLVDTVLAKSSDPEVIRQGREALLAADVKKAEDLMAGGRQAEATALMQNVLMTTTSERLKAHLQQSLLAAESAAILKKQFEIVRTALDKANEGKYSEALKMIDGVLPQITDADLKERVQKLRVDIAAARRRK